MVERYHFGFGCDNVFECLLKHKSLRPQFVDTFFIARLISNMSMRRAVFINYFLVHKMGVENLILLTTQVLLRSSEVSLT